MDKNIIIKIVLHLPPQLIFELYCKHKFINQSRLVRIAVARYLSTFSFFKLLDYAHANHFVHLRAHDCKKNDLKVHLDNYSIDIESNGITFNLFNFEDESNVIFKILYNVKYELLILYSVYYDIFDEVHILEKYVIRGMKIIKNKIKFKVREVK